MGWGIDRVNDGDLQVNKERKHRSYKDGHLCNEVWISSLTFLVTDGPRGSYEEATKRSGMFDYEGKGGSHQWISSMTATAP